MRVKKRNLWSELGFVLPAFLLFSVFVIYPFVSTFLYSFTQWNGFTQPVLNGLENYKRLFREQSFLIALKNTAIFAVGGLLFSNVLSLLLALGLNRKNKINGLFRAIFYIPCTISFVAMSTIWTQIYHYDGLINRILEIFGMEDMIQAWLGAYQTVVPAMLVIMVWSGVGFGMLIFMSGLNSIPSELLEAAQLDGAGFWQKFRYVTFPLLMPSVTVVTFLGLSTTLKMFDLPFTLTGGGPGDASNTIAMIIYKQAFSYDNFGYASAGGVILFIFVMIVSLLQLRLTRSKEVEA